MTRHLTPPAIAKNYGVKPEKVLAWIRAGELAAVNIATKPNGRPRYSISEEAIQVFECRRSAAPTPRPTRRRKMSDPEVIEFY